MFNEAINVPPHLPKLWLEKVFEKAKILEDKFKNYKYVKQSVNIEQEVLSSRKRLFEKLSEIYLPISIRNVYTDKSNTKLSNLIEDFYTASKLNMSSSKYFYQIDLYKNNKKDIDNWINEYKEIKLEDNFNELINDIKENDENVESFYKSFEFYQSLYEYLNLLIEVHVKLEAFKERDELRQNRYYDSSLRIIPKHEKFETLYHATPFVKEILREGFKTKEQTGINVLGGETENSISFTADIEIAKEIARSIKDVINIAKGNITLKDLVRIAKEENIDIKKFSEWIEDYKSYVRKKRQGGKLDYFSKKIIDPFDPNENLYDDIKYHIYQFYRNYMMHTSVRYNPLFFGVTNKNFENLNINNVGVLAADCDMSKITRYLESMEEFRIKIDGIFNVRLIS